MCVFPVDNKKILLLGGRNPALTHFQSLSTERFIRQTRMAHIKMSLFYSWFSTVSSDPAHFASLHREARSCPSCRGPPQGVSISLPPPIPKGYKRCSGAGVAGGLRAVAAGTAGWGWGSSHYRVLGFSLRCWGRVAGWMLHWREDVLAALGDEPEEEMGNQHGEFVCYEQECCH